LFWVDRIHRSSFNQRGSGRKNFGRRFLYKCDRGDEAVTHPDDGLDELRIVRIVAEQVAELTDSGINAVFSIDEDFALPEPVSDLAARDQLAFSRGEQDEQFQRLTLDAQGVAVTEELERSTVKPEVTEMIDKAAQGILLCGGSMTQCRRKRPDLKGFAGSPKLHLRLHPLSIAPASIPTSLWAAGDSGQGEEGHENK
jgi:hypothetical protein